MMDMQTLSHSSTPSNSVSENLNADTSENGSPDPELVKQLKQWIKDLHEPTKREAALHNLSKLSSKREEFPDLAVWLWNSYGTMTILLTEILLVAPYIHPPRLTNQMSTSVCNTLALLQCIASHKDTRLQMLHSNLHMFLYSFLHTTKTERPYEYVRLTSLGVIGALVRSEDKDVIALLLQTEIVPLCLRIMESGSDLSKTVASFILQKILTLDTGLNYICQTYERFNHVAKILKKSVENIASQRNSQTSRLFKQVVRCYSRLSYNAKAVHGLLEVLPDQLKDDTFKTEIDGDPQLKEAWTCLKDNLEKAGKITRPFVREPANM
ncbi:Cell differentiation protein RCD1 homolog [Strongyloides ratti]|uniref:CCR4-NOT transcription complex subunit 9 n=1 Tax=Strongyloides ratti TaxID=34506 RepID=A0A090LAY2_STRRB|nr:Cell differentiation protein RCD1 homolog [Strongyloides ratti]CEF66917.1 Cell differentiation protein RCD1 homolog [Strongyloides ratti]